MVARSLPVPPPTRLPKRAPPSPPRNHAQGAAFTGFFGDRYRQHAPAVRTSHRCPGGLGNRRRSTGTGRRQAGVGLCQGLVVFRFGVTAALQAGAGTCFVVAQSFVTGVAQRRSAVVHRKLGFGGDGRIGVHSVRRRNGCEQEQDGKNAGFHCRLQQSERAHCVNQHANSL